MSHISLITLALRLAAIVAGGTVFFRLVEKWSWIDSYFFTVVTISTVGYGHPIPVTNLGKIGATVLIFGGLGVVAVALQQIAFESLSERDRNPGAVHRMVLRLHRKRQERRAARQPAPDPTDGENGTDT